MNKISKVLSLTATDEMIGLRADKAVGLLDEVGTRSRAESLFQQHLVKINGHAAKSSIKIKAGDFFEIELPAEKSSDLIPLDLKLDILFEDEDLIVLNKPSGLVVHPAAGHANDTLVNALLQHTQQLSMKFGEARPGIVHRLDKETSGVMVVAKNDETHEALTQQFKNRTIHRIYYAACFGSPKEDLGKICSFLARHPTDRKRYASILNSERKILRDPVACPPFGKWAVTNFSVVTRLEKSFCLLRLKLETGRTHQIRIHLSEMGCPIIGDTLYGSDKKLGLVKSASKRALISRLDRFALHAAELGFIHPRTKENLLFKVPWPEDIATLLQALGFTGLQ